MNMRAGNCIDHIVESSFSHCRKSLFYFIKIKKTFISVIAALLRQMSIMFLCNKFIGKLIIYRGCVKVISPIMTLISIMEWARETFIDHNAFEQRECVEWRIDKFYIKTFHGAIPFYYSFTRKFSEFLLYSRKLINLSPVINDSSLLLMYSFLIYLSFGECLPYWFIVTLTFERSKQWIILANCYFFDSFKKLWNVGSSEILRLLFRSELRAPGLFARRQRVSLIAHYWVQLYRRHTQGHNRNVGRHTNKQRSSTGQIISKWM